VAFYTPGKDTDSIQFICHKGEFKMFLQSTLVDQLRAAWWRWFSLLAVFIILVLGQAAEASGLPLVAVHVPQQQVDTDGDGNRDPFSADFSVNSDGTASGTINLSLHNKVTLKRGVIDWEGNNELAVLEGDHYRLMNGNWLQTGTVEVHYECAACKNAGGDIIVFDIIDSVHPASFTANGVVQRDYTAGMLIPTTQVDTDGDSVLDTFSAYSFTFNGGVAAGTIQLDTDSKIVVSSGTTVCQDGVPVVVVKGVRYQQMGSFWIAQGDTQAEGRPAGGGGGGDIVVFDIIDSVTNQHVSFEAAGELPMVAGPCDQ
jgi:hypothetical protein